MESEKKLLEALKEVRSNTCYLTKEKALEREKRIRSNFETWAKLVEIYLIIKLETEIKEQKRDICDTP